MAGLYARIAQVPALLFVSPIYWFTYSAQLKAAIDRLYCLRNWDNDFLKGKKAGAVFVYGDVDPYASGAVNAMATFDIMRGISSRDARERTVARGDHGRLPPPSP